MFHFGTSDPRIRGFADVITKSVEYASELQEYRANRNRPNNKLYYALKLSEEAGEVAEVCLALEGSRRKIAKLGGKASAREALVEELGDTLNVVMLLAEHHDLNMAEILESGRNKLEVKRISR